MIQNPFMMKVRIAFFLVALLSKPLLSAQVIEQDSLALVAFYHATNGPAWTDNTNWLSNAPVGQWYAIQVNGGRVTSLGLHYNNLTGELPPEIGNLTGLIELYPYGNQMTGMLPTELGNLTMLEYLDLADNQFTGSVPASFANFTNLRSISLYRNAFSGPFPEALLSLHGLEILELGYNDFSGPIPPEIGGMIALQVFGIEDNAFSGGMPSLKGLTNLGALYLSSNQLTGDVADFLGYYPNMWYLRLNQNAFTGCVSDSFFNSEKLQFLDFVENQITCLGDFSGFIQSGILKRITAQGNAIPFEDLETCVGVFQFTYSPQQPLLDSAMHFLALGDSISIESGSGGIYTQYQWYHDGLPIAGATSTRFVIDDFGNTDQGTYHCEMTNAMLPGLTLTRNPVTLILEGASSTFHPRVNAIHLSPNPADDFIFLNNLEGVMRIVIVDAKGQVMLQTQVNGDQTIDVSHLVAGVYFMIAYTTENMYACRFFKSGQ